MMPLTPLHLGAGFLAKGVAYDRVSMTSFVLSQVAIDAPVAFRLFSAQPEWPFHRAEHAMVSAVAIGILSALAVWRLGWARWPSSETRLGPALAGGLIGGITHVLMDALVHDDVQPLWPLATGNHWLDAIPWVVHLRLLAAATLVGGVLIIRRRRAAASTPARPLLGR